MPCSNCSRWKVECTFPSPIRTARRPRKRPAGSEESGDDNLVALESSQSRFPFGSSSANIEEKKLSPEQIQSCWRNFLVNVDPLVKVLHQPSTECLIRRAIDNETSIRCSEKALLAVVVFTSIFSMPSELVNGQFLLPKHVAVAKHRSISEQALVEAEFLTSDDLTTLQAFVLFLSFTRFNSESKLAWGLSGLARRLSCSAKLDMTLFEREMRKRLYWHLWYIDQRATEDHGRSATNHSTFPEPGIPLSVDDEDLELSMTQVPTERIGWSQMSFTLIRIEIARTSCNIEGNENLSFEQKETMIDLCEIAIHSTHLAQCKDGDPMHWLAKHITFVLVNEMRFKLYGQRPVLATDPPRIAIARNLLFHTAMKIVDAPRQLEGHEQSKQWGWLLSAYLQFVPLAFLLTGLCHRSNCSSTEDVEKAWVVAELAMRRWDRIGRDLRNREILVELITEAKERRGNAHSCVQTNSSGQSSFDNTPTETDFADSFDLFTQGCPWLWSEGSFDLDACEQELGFSTFEQALGS